MYSEIGCTCTEVMIGQAETKFCMNGCACWSADVSNLKQWRYEGVIYRRDQDPRMKDGTRQLWAPDVVRGKNGGYYLYYCPDGDGEAIGVAVCEEPAGTYEFYGIVHDKEGRLIGKREGDIWQFDRAGVFIDDDGKIVPLFRKRSEENRSGCRQEYKKFLRDGIIG